MNFKKGIKVLATGVLSVSLLAACGSTGSKSDSSSKSSNKAKTTKVAQVKPEDGSKLTVWYEGGDDKAWAEKVAKDFTAKYGVQVKLDVVGSVDAPGKIAKDGPAGLAADVFVAPHDHVGQMVAEGSIMQNMFADEYKKQDLDAAIEGVSANNDQGKLTVYGYPLAIETYALFYNKDLLAKEGLEIPKTWDELFADATKFNNDTSVSGKHYGFMMDVGNYYFMHSFLAGYGGYVFGKNGTDPTDLGLGGEPAAKTADFVTKMHTVLPMKQASITSDVMTSLFNTGKLLFYVDGPWAVAGHRDAKVNFSVAPLPKLDNDKYPQSFSGIKSMFVSAYTKYPKAATLFAQYATSADSLKARYEVDGQIPVAKSLLEDQEIKSNEIIANFLEQATHAIPMPNITEMQSVWTPMGTAFVTAWDKPAGSAPFDKAQKMIQDAIKSQTK
jgi:arabinogalactan oligomer/maltooligosaccharide transport system substrate-binding protein